MTVTVAVAVAVVVTMTMRVTVTIAVTVIMCTQKVIVPHGNKNNYHRERLLHAVGINKHTHEKKKDEKHKPTITIYNI